MSEKEKNEQNSQELDLDELEQVTGGAFENVPRVPEHKIDDNIKSKI